MAPYSAVFTDFSNQELIYTRGFAGTDEVKYQATRVQAYYNEGKWGPTESFMELVGDDPRKTVILKNGVGDVFGPQQTIRKASNAEGTMPTYLMRYSEIYMMKAECESPYRERRSFGYPECFTFRSWITGYYGSDRYITDDLSGMDTGTGVREWA